MDSIRSSARREAWKYYDGESRNYNPFARARIGDRKSLGDVEALHTTQTAESVPSHLETGRRQHAQHEYRHPDRADTAPQASTRQPPHDRDQADIEAPRTGTAATEDTEKDTDPKSSNGEDRSSATLGEREETRSVRSIAFQDTGDDPNARPSLRRRVLGKLKRSDTSNTTESQMSEGRKRRRKKIPAMQQFKAVLLGSWVNLLLLAVPVGFALNYAHVDGKAIFVVNFVAIIPLAATLSFATEELAMYVGETLGGLLNASFGNATELIVSIIALAQQKIVIVQTSLIGSMLSNLLLVLGMCFFFGGITRVRQHFNITVAQTASSLLALSVGSLIIPTAFVRFGSDTDADTIRRGVGPISRGTSIILLLVYASYLFFQLKTHRSMYNEPSKKGQKFATGKKEEGEALLSIARMGANSAATAGGHANQRDLVQRPAAQEEDEEEPTLSVLGALVTLGISTVLIAFCSEFMVTGIDAIAGSLSPEFIGLILLPIVGNAAEHATAVTVACKDKMDLAIGVAVGSSMQIALLVLPLMVVIGWCGLGQPYDMTLDFDGFQVAVLFIAVLLVNYLIQDGESHWLEGVLLASTYVIIAVSAYFYPIDESKQGGALT